MAEEDWAKSESAKLRALSVRYRMDESDVSALSALLAKELGLAITSVRPLSACVWPVFKVETADRGPLFVKVAPADIVEKSLSFLRTAGACGLVPKALTPHPVPFGFRSVMCTEWREGTRVEAERMTEVQADALLDGVRELSDALQSAPIVRPPDGADAPERLYGIVAGYAARHPFLARLLKPLLEIPAAERDYGSRPTRTIHGDLHVKNYAFDGDRLSVVFDFDSLEKGLPCEDVTYAFTERMRRSALGAAAKARLCALFRRLVERSPWPKEEWRIAVNHARLRIAAKRLLKHPDGWAVAFDVRRRDRELRPLLEVLA